jgi:hypothetical protein
MLKCTLGKHTARKGDREAEDAEILSKVVMESLNEKVIFEKKN